MIPDRPEVIPGDFELLPNKVQTSLRLCLAQYSNPIGQTSDAFYNVNEFFATLCEYQQNVSERMQNSIKDLEERRLHNGNSIADDYTENKLTEQSNYVNSMKLYIKRMKKYFKK